MSGVVQKICREDRGACETLEVRAPRRRLQPDVRTRGSEEVFERVGREAMAHAWTRSIVSSAGEAVASLSKAPTSMFPEPCDSFTRFPHTSDPPNKAPEPTSTSVMPRAIEAKSDRPKPTTFPNQARATPAEAVAHL